MTPQNYEGIRLEITRLIGKKDLTRGCLVTLNSVWQKYSEKPQKWRLAEYITEWKYLWKTQILTANNANRRFKSSWEVTEIIGHPATISDFHRWMNENIRESEHWQQFKDSISIVDYKLQMEQPYSDYFTTIPYDSSKYLLDQETSTLEQIISLIKSNA